LKRLLPIIVIAALLPAVALMIASGQAGRHSQPGGDSGIVLGVVAARTDGSPTPILSKHLAIYDNGIEQFIKNFSPDPSPARIVLLVDNSLTFRADVKKLEGAALEFAYEIFEGDKLLVVGYDEQAEIVSDWTDNAKSMEASLKSFRKKGQPHLFDALTAVLNEALTPLAATSQKRVIVVISDGLDRGSKSRFEQTLSSLQLQDVTVYAVQAPDRTGGALRRDQPKPVQVIQKLVDGTGGRIFPISDPQTAAKSICDELRKNRYLLAYSPSSIPFGETRRILLLGSDGVTVRSKTAQPPVIH